MWQTINLPVANINNYRGLCHGLHQQADGGSRTWTTALPNIFIVMAKQFCKNSLIFSKYSANTKLTKLTSFSQQQASPKSQVFLRAKCQVKLHVTVCAHLWVRTPPKSCKINLRCHEMINGWNGKREKVTFATESDIQFCNIWF